MWLYLPPEAIPSTPSQSAPASEASNSDCNSLTAISERLCEASATSRGKLLPSQAWSRRWKRGGYILRLSGLTLEPSTADRFADAWISSLRATRAKAIALPESAAANSTTAGSSIAPSTSSIKAGLQPSSARTCRGTLTGNSPSQSRHWSDWAAALRSEYSARPKPAIRCAGSDSSSSLDDQWPAPQARTTGGGEYTDPDKAAARISDGVHQVNLSERAITWAAPQARDHFPAHTDEYIAAKKAQGHGMRNLNDEAAQWMAPNVPNGGRSTSHAEQVGKTMYHDGKKVQMGLESQASKWASPKASDPEKAGPNMRGSKGDIPLPAQAMNWAAPAARDYKGSNEGSMYRQDGKSRADLLDCQAEQFFHPPSSPDQPIIAGGSTSSTDTPNSNQPSVKRKLNPIFVEALMRWPTGLSGFERPATALIQWQQQQLSYVSMLCSPVEAAQREMF